MKKLWLVLLLLLTISLVACQNSDESAKASTTKVSEEEKYGGELTFAISVPVVSELLDPHRAASPGNSRIQRSIFDSLVIESEDNTFSPWLAKEWEISEDGKSYTFKLREDVLFHDGTPFNAEAVKFNFDRIVNLESPGLSIHYLGPYESTEVMDEYTVKVNFSKPHAAFLRTLASEHLGMVSPSAIEKYGDEFTLNPVGTGPFKFVESTPGTEYIVERNEDYNWAPKDANHQGPTYLDRIVFKIITEESTRVNTIQSGDVDAIDTIPPQNLDLFESNADYNLLEVEMLNYNAAIHFNVTNAPLDDINVREALRLAADWDSIVNTVYLGTYNRAYSSLSPSLFGYDDSLESKWEFNVEKAGKILDEQGWTIGKDGIREKAGKKLTVNMIDFYANREKRMDVMTLVQNAWKEIGVELNINTIPVGSYQEKMAKGDYHLWIGSQIGADPDAALRAYLLPEKRGYKDSFQNPYIEELLDAASVELDDTKRAEIYKDLQSVLFENVYTIPVYVLPYTVATKNTVHDLTFDVKGFPLFYDVWIEE